MAVYINDLIRYLSKGIYNVLVVNAKAFNGVFIHYIIIANQYVLQCHYNDKQTVHANKAVLIITH